MFSDSRNVLIRLLVEAAQIWHTYIHPDSRERTHQVMCHMRKDNIRISMDWTVVVCMLHSDSRNVLIRLLVQAAQIWHTYIHPDSRERMHQVMCDMRKDNIRTIIKSDTLYSQVWFFSTERYRCEARQKNCNMNATATMAVWTILELHLTVHECNCYNGCLNHLRTTSDSSWMQLQQWLFEPS